ncbi:hypothetical protein [Longitalea arenae]|uniref:hypothetical protein n=1 Tax=Longitalea arenae TaxID=2812558 RepID=UPI001967549B|nr:hypothetical protein [Longitalea arenae]
MKKYLFTVITAGVVLLAIQLSGCEKKTDNISSDAVTDYLNLQTGKYILYRYDSLRFVDHDQRDTIVSYQAKDIVEGQLTDNLGRAGWRIVRYLRDFNSTNDNDWKPLLTYHVIPSAQNIEMNESNFRYVKLVIPVKDGVSWRGNGYLPDNPYEGVYDFSNDQDIRTWDYTYHDVGASLTLNNKTYDSTITVVQIADSTNLPLEPGVSASKTYWVEKYAKNIGLVYKEVAVWEYQPPTTVSGYLTGFGVTMTIMDHN